MKNKEHLARPKLSPSIEMNTCVVNHWSRDFYYIHVFYSRDLGDSTQNYIVYIYLQRYLHTLQYLNYSKAPKYLLKSILVNCVDVKLFALITGRSWTNRTTRSNWTTRQSCKFEFVVFSLV